MSLTPTPLYCLECGCQQIEAHKGPIWAENPLGKMVYILESIVIAPIVAIRCGRAFVSRTIF
jgi:hypothetical protein